MFGVNSKSYPTSITKIMLCKGLCSRKGVCLNNTYNSSKHIYHLTRPWASSAFSIHLLKLISPLLLMISILKQRLLKIEKHLILPWLIHHIFFSGPLGMVYKLSRDCFVLDDFMSNFDIFFEVCGYIAQDHVSHSVSCLLLCIPLRLVR
jgi:hypothetical protein